MFHEIVPRSFYLFWRLLKQNTTTFRRADSANTSIFESLPPCGAPRWDYLPKHWEVSVGGLHRAVTDHGALADRDIRYVLLYF